MPLPIILMYHSVDDRNGRSDVWGNSVSPGNFASQIEALVSERTVVPVEELTRCVRAGRVPGTYAAITFDDGYANNLAFAKPILEQYGAPATLFLMTSTLDRPGFWWDRLEHIVLEAEPLPAKFCITLPDQTLEFTVEGDDRAQTMIAIWRRVRLLDPDHRDMAIAHMGNMVGVQSENPALRPLTTREAQQLDGGIFSVGAHTHSHPSLPALSPPEQKREIVDNMAICERLLNRPITKFAYPFGDYDDRVRASVAETGLALACTTVPRPVQSGDDCLALPRIQAGNWTGDQLIRSLGAETYYG